MQMIQVPIDPLKQQIGPAWTRATLTSLAQARYPGARTSLQISAIVDECYEGCSIELATVELKLCEEGGCTLQYVSHPSQSHDLTGSIHVLTTDLMAYADALTLNAADTAPEVIAASWMQAEGLGPLALLDLRLTTRVPIVPTEADAVALRAMIAQSIADDRLYKMRSHPKTFHSARTS